MLPELPAPIYKHKRWSKKQMRNLKRADFSYEETTPPDSPHVGSNTDANQPHSASRDHSEDVSPMYSEHREKNQDLQVKICHHQPRVIF